MVKDIAESDIFWNNKIEFVFEGKIWITKETVFLFEILDIDFSKENE